MKTAMLAVAMWGLVLGYWVLYQGVTTLQSVGKGSGGSGGPSRQEGDEMAFLAAQPIAEAMLG